MENNEFSKIRIKNRTCYYFNDIIKIEDIDFDKILIDEKIKRKYFDSRHFIQKFNWSITFLY